MARDSLFPLPKTRSIFESIGLPFNPSNDFRTGENLFKTNPITEEDITPPPMTTRDRMMAILNEGSPSTERYDEYLKTQPKYEDYAPSKKRKFGSAVAAALLGFTNPQLGMETAANIQNQPYKEKMIDWEEKRLPLANAAKTEGDLRKTRLDALKDIGVAEDRESRDRQTAAFREAEITATKARDAALERDRIADNERAIAAAKALEEERKRTEDNRKADNEARDAAALEQKRQFDLQQKVRDAELELKRAAAKDRETRTNIYKSSVEGLNKYRQHLIDKVKSEKKDSPGAQKTADELATLNAFLVPGNSQRFAEFFEQDDKGKVRIVPPDRSFFDSEESFNEKVLEYAELQRQINSERTKILGSFTPPASSSSGRGRGSNPSEAKKPTILSREPVSK